MMIEIEPFSENQEKLYEELSMPEESEFEAEANKKLFCNNLELILGNADIVINNPEFFHISHKWSYIGSNWIGKRYLPLGVLLMLWQKDLFIAECPKCNSKVYLFQAGGLVLSGSYSYEAVCINCREIVSGERASGFGTLIKPALDLYNEAYQKRKVLYKMGPDKILEDVIKPASLAAMINSFKDRDK